MFKRAYRSVSKVRENPVVSFGRTRGKDDLSRIVGADCIGHLGAGMLNGIMGAATPSVERVSIAELIAKVGKHSFQNTGVERCCRRVVEIAFPHNVSYEVPRFRTTRFDGSAEIRLSLMTIAFAGCQSKSSPSKKRSRIPTPGPGNRRQLRFRRAIQAAATPQQQPSSRPAGSSRTLRHEP